MSETIPGQTATVPTSLVGEGVKLWPVSRKLSILRALSEHLEGITRENNYEFDLSPVVSDAGHVTPRVQRGRAVFGDDTPVPFLSILEGPVPDRDPPRAGMNEVAQHVAWVMFLQGWAEGPEINPTDPCYQFMASVELRLSEIISVRKSGTPVNQGAYLLGNQISGFMVGPGVVRPAQDQVSSKPFFYLPVILQLPVDITRPFV